MQCVFLASLAGVLALAPAPGQAPASSSSATGAVERLASWELHRRLQRESPCRHLRWRPLGPAFQGGRIEAIACHSARPYTLYAGAGSGSLWKSSDDGLSWTPIFTDQPAFSIGALAIAPSDPDTIWVGTGENLMARSSFAGMGVFRSRDGGASWVHAGLAETHHIGRVAVDPRDPDTAYVAALGHLYTTNPERGVFKTTDGGKSWRKVLYVNERSGAVDVIVDPGDPAILYASTWERDRKAWNHVPAGSGSGVWRSRDRGETWCRLRAGLPAGPKVGRIGLGLCRSRPQVVYALVDNEAPHPHTSPGKARTIDGEVYRSDDGGESWRKVNEKDLDTSIGYAFGDIRVAPDNPERIYVLGNRLLRSDDGGRSFRRAGEAVRHLLEHGHSGLHLDHHDLWIDPERPQRLLLGNDGGLYSSHDGGDSWLHLNTLPIAEFYAISADMAKPFRIYGGTQDNAALFGPSTHTWSAGGRDPWRHVYIDPWGGGDSYFTYPDPSDPQRIYYEQQFGHLQRRHLGSGAHALIKPRAAEGAPPLRCNWMSPFLISHFNPFILYFGAQRVYRSVNKGDLWTCISPDLSGDPGPEHQGNVPYGTLTTLSESPLRPGLIYAGSDDGRVHVTSDDGASWRRIDAGLPQKWVSRVVASGHDRETVYVTLSGYREDDFQPYVYRSSDRGVHWQSLAANLPLEPVNVLREDPRDDQILYLGTDLGVYVSFDRGGRWHGLGSGLPTCAVHDLLVHPRDHQVVIGTHGLSAFLLDGETLPQIKAGTSPAESGVDARR